MTLELEPRDGGTLVSITENPAGIQRPLGLFPPLHLLTKARNAESLARIERLATAPDG